MTHETSCQEFLSQIYLYLDNELENVERFTEMDIHFAECPPCHEVAAAEQRVRELLSKCCGCDETPDPVRTRLLERLTEIRVQLTLGEAQ